MTTENRFATLARTVVAVLFVILVPLFLIALNVRWVINFRLCTHTVSTGTTSRSRQGSRGKT